MKRRRKRRRCNLKVKQNEEDTPEDGTTMEVQSSFLKEDNRTQMFSADPSQKGALTIEEEEEEAAESQTTSSPKKALMSFHIPEGIPGIEKMNPTLLLKSVFKPAVGYLCDLCSQSFTSSSQLLKHKQLHEENSENLPTNETEVKEPKPIEDLSFSCNMCDQSFTTTQMLKRHKLLHVRDGRKCPWCGVIFCKRHNHVLFLPQTQAEQECNVDESEPEEPEKPEEPKEPQESEEPEETPESEESEQSEEPKFEEPEVSKEPQEPQETEEPEEPQESEGPETNDDAQSVLTKTQIQSFPIQVVSPTSTAPVHLPVIINPLRPPSQGRIFQKAPVPRLRKLPQHSLKPPNANVDLPLRHVHSLPPKHLNLPTYLQVFSPQRLTSVFLHVQRNYDYILEKAKDHNGELAIIKEEKQKKKVRLCEKTVIPPCPQQAVPQFAQSDVHIKRERIAYDMEIVL